ncbi:MAG: PLD nuclease N-terminal domain-containing protein [Candidatus Limnocylindria bacterium]
MELTGISTGQLLAIIAPIVVLEVVLLGLGLWDLTRPDRRVRGDNKLVWGLVIVFVGVFGPLIYFFFGREDV